MLSNQIKLKKKEQLFFIYLYWPDLTAQVIFLHCESPLSHWSPLSEPSGWDVTDPCLLPWTFLKSHFRKSFKHMFAHNEGVPHFTPHSQNHNQAKDAITWTMCFLRALTLCTCSSLLSLSCAAVFSLSSVVKRHYQVEVATFADLRALYYHWVFCCLLLVPLKLTPWGFINSSC